MEPEKCCQIHMVTCSPLTKHVFWHLVDGKQKTHVATIWIGKGHILFMKKLFNKIFLNKHWMYKYILKSKNPPNIVCNSFMPFLHCGSYIHQNINHQELFAYQSNQGIVATNSQRDNHNPSFFIVLEMVETCPSWYRYKNEIIHIQSLALPLQCLYYFMTLNFTHWCEK